MIRRLLRTCAALLLVAGAGSVVASSPASAVASPTIDDVGWWGRLNQDPLPTGALLYPDVAPGQLLVEGTPDGASAIAALRATLPEGTADPVLTLRAASSAGGPAAVLLACQSGSGWTGAHAGSWESKPSPDCSRSVQGVPDEEAGTWTFALAPLQFGDQVDVVLTPGVLADQQPPSAFRIVFDRPGPDAVAVSERTGPPAAPPSQPSFGGGTTTGGGPSAAPAVDVPESPSFSVPTPPTAAQLEQQPAQAALPPAEQGATATAPALAPEPLAAPPVPVSGSDGRALGALVVLAAGALLWWSSQQPVPERQVLSRFATAAVGTTSVAPAPEPTLGGLGRFRRERTTPARRIG